MPSVPPAAPVSGGALFARYWLPALAYVGLIFALSSLQTTGPALFRWQDKAEHLLEYALLGLLLGRAFRVTIGGRGLPWVLGTVAAGSLVGAADEIYQRSVPGRVSDVRDWATDAAGLIAAVLLTRLVSARTPGRRVGEAPGAASGAPHRGEAAR